MKNYLTILIILFCLGCTVKKKKNFSEISSKMISETNDLSFKYNKRKYIDSLFVKFKLDERSFEKYNEYELKTILLYINDKRQKVIKNFKIDKKEVTFSYCFINENLDSISSMFLETIGKENGITVMSNLYAYKNTLSVLGKQNTYLDYKAFKNKNSIFKNISRSNTKIDSILVSVKTRKNIGDITKLDIQLNKKINLSYRTCIRADTNIPIKTIDKKVTLYNLLKHNKNYLSFKLSLKELNLTKIKTIDVILSQ